MTAPASAPTARRPAIVLRPFGSSMPLGLTGLAVASFVVSGLDLGWVATSDSHAIGLMLLAGAAPLQLLGCVFAFPARDGVAGTTMGLLAATWISMGLVRLLSAPGSTSDPLGLLMLVTGALVGGSALAQLSDKPLVGLAIALAAARFVFSALYELTSAGGWQTVSGILGLGVVATAAYLVVALEIEEARDRAVLPTFRRGRALLSAGERSAGADGPVHQAGVRPQL